MTTEKKVDRLFVDKRDLDDFNRLKDKVEKDSPFAGSQNKDVFLAAMVTGYHEGGRVALKTKEGYFWKSYLRDEELALIRAIAVAEEKSLNVLLDEAKVFQIAEEYAAGGIQLLKTKVFGESYGSYAKKLESELLRTLEKAISEQPKSQTVEEIADLSIQDLIKNDESNSVEFKSSLIWDYAKKKPDKSLLGMVIARTISCFMNSKGGIILIGVGDDKKVLGLENDLAQLDGSTDNFELHLTNVINKHLGKIKGTLVRVKFEKVEDKQVVALIIKESPRPVYLKHEGKTQFYIRSSNSCQPLDVSEATEYIKDHWPDLP